MKVGNFILEIPQGTEMDGGHVEMVHATPYTVRFGNLTSSRCDVTVSIDGVGVGKWRLEAGQTAEVEHPTRDPGRFTFFALETGAAEAAKIAINTETGLISAKFFTEIVALRAREEGRMHARLRVTDEALCQASIETHRAGGTGLSGKSAQLYRDADRIETSDQPDAIINLRLVVRKNRVIENSRPLSNPIPEPLT